MLEMDKRHWILGLAHAAIWVGITLIVERGLGASPARDAYALLSAWWATLYVSLLVGTTWRAVSIFLFGMAIALAIDATLGTQVLYHDPPNVRSSAFGAILLLQGALWSSPFAVNECVRRGRDKLRGRTQSK